MRVRRVVGAKAEARVCSGVKGVVILRVALVLKRATRALAAVVGTGLLYLPTVPCNQKGAAAWCISSESR